MPARDYAWLPLSLVLAYQPVAAAQGVSEVARSPRGFVAAYRAAGGDPERMSAWWRTRRRNFVARHLAQAVSRDEPTWRDGVPSRRHLALIMWAYSPLGEGLTMPSRSKRKRVVRRRA